MKRGSQLIIASLFIIALFGAGCGKSEPEITLKEPEFKKYPFKSALIEYTFTGDGSGTMRHFIDYWGVREVQEDKSTIKMMGQERKNNMLIISDQDTSIQINMTDSSGMKMKDPRWDSMIQSFKKMTADQKKNFASEMMKTSMQQFQAKAVGTEDILGKKCEIFEVQGYKISIWNGLPLKSVVSMNGMNMTVTATKLETDVDVPLALFTPPVGIKMQQLGQQQIGMPPQGQDPNAQQGDPHSTQDPHSAAPTQKEQGKGQ